jgi:uncharacterized membrane protein
MPHPVPNLAVNPIYGVAWIMLAVWLVLLIALAIGLYRITRRQRNVIRTRFKYWIASRSTAGSLTLHSGTLPRLREHDPRSR